MLDERFGMSLGTADRLFFAQARANPSENFRLVCNDEIMRSIVGRMDDNADLFRKILDEPAFKAALMDHCLRRVYEGARADGG